MAVTQKCTCQPSKEPKNVSFNLEEGQRLNLSVWLLAQNCLCKPSDVPKTDFVTLVGGSKCQPEVGQKQLLSPQSVCVNLAVRQLLSKSARRLAKNCLCLPCSSKRRPKTVSVIALWQLLPFSGNKTTSVVALWQLLPFSGPKTSQSLNCVSRCHSADL